MAVRNSFHLAPSEGLDHEDPVDVLFVAGDPDLAELYRMKLELDGYYVTVVTSIEAAIEAASRQPADIIYLDLGDLRLQAIASTGTPCCMAVVTASRHFGCASSTHALKSGSSSRLGRSARR